MRLLYKFFHNSLLILFPVALVLTSVTMILPRADLHKQVIASGDFYLKLSQELKKMREDPNLDFRNGISPILYLSALQDVATPEWLRNLVEQNVDLTTDWLSGRSEDWVLFAPTKEIQEATAKQIDQVTKDLVAKNPAKIPTCSEQEAKVIQREGFATQGQLCLPKEVIEGTKSMTDFLSLQSEQAKQNLFAIVLKDSPFTSLTDKFRISTINNTLKNRLNGLRDGFIWLKDRLIFLWLVLLVLLVVDLLLAVSVNKTIYKEVQRISWLTSISTLSLSLTLILAFGGSAFLTARANSFFLPGLPTNSISTLIFWQIIKLILEFLSLALIVIVALLALDIVLVILDRFGLFSNVAKRNQKLQRQAVPGLLDNKTFDGEFHRLIQQKRQNSKFTPNTGGVNFDVPQQDASQSFNYDDLQRPQIIDSFDYPDSTSLGFNSKINTSDDLSLPQAVVVTANPGSQNNPDRHPKDRELKQSMDGSRLSPTWPDKENRIDDKYVNNPEAQVNFDDFGQSRNQPNPSAAIQTDFKELSSNNYSPSGTNDPSLPSNRIRGL